jgi:hypothetical protein
MHGIYLSRLPLSAKVCASLFLMGIGLGAVAALAQAATAVGLSSGEVIASLAPDMPMTHMGHGQLSAEREIDLGQLSQSAKVWIRTPLLIQTSHTHLFDQTLIAGLLGGIFLLTSLGEAKKAVIVALPFIGTILDIGGHVVNPHCLVTLWHARPDRGQHVRPGLSADYRVCSV